MLKTAIKHYIYELCINIFFDNIEKNFVLLNKKQSINSKRNQIKVGDYYKSIYEIDVFEEDFYRHFYNCSIVKVAKDYFQFLYTDLDEGYINGPMVDTPIEKMNAYHVMYFSDDFYVT